VNRKKKKPLVQEGMLAISAKSKGGDSESHKGRGKKKGLLPPHPSK